jgi:hypothetical protein
MGINPMNKITIIIRILFAVTLFQQIYMISPNGLTPSTPNESLTLQDSSLKIIHISLMFLNAEPSIGIWRTPSSLMCHAW